MRTILEFINQTKPIYEFINKGHIKSDAVGPGVCELYEFDISGDKIVYAVIKNNDELKTVYDVIGISNTYNEHMFKSYFDKYGYLLVRPYKGSISADLRTGVGMKISDGKKLNEICRLKKDFSVDFWKRHKWSVK